MNLSKIKHWEKDLKYYDPENIEIKTLLKLADFRDKIVLDVGCGVGRLTVPISKISKKILAIDKDEDIIKYCKKYKRRKNIEYINADIRNFRNNKFDIAILAQPLYTDFGTILYSIYENLKENGKLVIIRWIDKGNDYNTILTPFWNKDRKLIKSVNNFSQSFIRDVRKYFNIKRTIIVHSYCSYPNKEFLIESIEQDSPRKFNLKDRATLDNLLKKYNYKKIKIAMKMYLCEKRG